jgi:hypothetical protein
MTTIRAQYAKSVAIPFMAKPEKPLSAVATECLQKSGLPWAQRIATATRG